MPSLVRPGTCDNASYGSAIGSSGRALCGGKEVEGAEDVQADESREPKKILRPASPTNADCADHEPLHLNYRVGAQTASGALGKQTSQGIHKWAEVRSHVAHGLLLLSQEEPGGSRRIAGGEHADFGCV